MLRIAYNIWFIIEQNVSTAYTIITFFIYLFCVAFPLLLVFW